MQLQVQVGRCQSQPTDAAPCSYGCCWWHSAGTRDHECQRHSASGSAVAAAWMAAQSKAAARQPRSDSTAYIDTPAPVFKSAAPTRKPACLVPLAACLLQLHLQLHADACTAQLHRRAHQCARRVARTAAQRAHQCTDACTAQPHLQLHRRAHQCYRRVVLRILGCLELHRRAHQCADACAYSCTDAPTNVSTHGTDGCIDRCSPQLLPRLCQQQHLRLHRLALRQIRGRQHPWPTPDPHELTNPANTSMSADGSMHTKASQNLSEFCSF